MKYLHAVWKGRNIWFNTMAGQFETDSGFSSYNESSVRLAAVNGF